MLLLRYILIILRRDTSCQEHGAIIREIAGIHSLAGTMYKEYIGYRRARSHTRALIGFLLRAVGIGV